MPTAPRLRAIADPVAQAVWAGLTATPRTLPPWLFYDPRGSELFEQITLLPEYYLTRAEAEIFADHGDEIVAALLPGGSGAIVELGAGTATKTELLLAAACRRHPRVTYVPVDVSATPLELARHRLGERLPGLTVTPWCASHHEAFERLPSLAAERAVLFIGSSIGNYHEADAIALLTDLRRALRRGDRLLLGTDLRKDPATLLAAYDDAAGVTAAFNQNILVRINRELGGDFDVARFRHVAVWNDAASRIEMHLESAGAQRVHLADLGLRLRFEDGERIHTESSVKYTPAMVDRILAAAGFRRVHELRDAGDRFAVHVARAI